MTVFALARAQRIRRAAGGLVRAALFFALIVIQFVVAGTHATAQLPPFQEPLRMRITWGGGAASQWSGRIALDRGTLSELNVAALNADSPGSVWLADRQVVVGSLSDRTAETIEVTALAEDSATLVVELSPTLESPPVRAQVSLGDLKRGAYQLKLDDHGNALTVENATNLVTIATDRQPLIFSPGERFSFEARVVVQNAEPGTTLDVRTNLISERGATQWSDEQRLAVPINGPLTLSLTPQLPLAEGVYTIRLTATRPPGFRPNIFLPGAAAPLAERSFKLVVIEPRPTEATAPGSWENVLEIDPTSPRWWERLPSWTQLRRIPGLNPGHLGTIRAASINHPLGQFVELPPTPERGEPHWQAYSLPLETAGVPHLLEIDFPADTEQRFGVSLLEPGSSQVIESNARDTGVYVEGLGRSALNQKQTHRVLFWPRSQVPLLLVTNQHSTAPAHFGAIRVLKRTGNRLAPHPPSPGTNDRLVAAYIALPQFAQTFGIVEPAAANTRSAQLLQGGDWNTHYLCATRLADYLRFAGYNSAVLSLNGDGKALGTDATSQTLGPTREDAPQADPLRADGLELLLRVFDREGLTLVPAINLSTPIAELEKLRRASNPQTSGLEWVDANGRTWLQSFGTQKGNAAYYNILNPRVQQEVFRAIGALMERYGRHPAFGGIAVQLSGNGFAQLPTPEWGLDDVTVARFENETGIQLQAAGPNRFAIRHAALTRPHAQAWRAWRAAQVTEFYRQLANLVCSGNDRRRLVLTAEQAFDHPQVNARMLPKILSDIRLDATLLDLGIDRVALMKLPGVAFCSTSYVAPAEPLPDRAVDLEVTDAFAVLRRQAKLPTKTDAMPASPPLHPAPAALLFHRAQRLALPSIAARSPLKVADNFQLACQPLPYAPALQQPYAAALAEADAEVLLDGGEVLQLSSDVALYETRQVLQHLPTAAQVVEMREQPLIVRTYSEPHRVTLLIVNACPWHTEAQVALDLPAILTMKPLVQSPDEVAQRDKSQILEPNGPPLAVSLEPYAIHAVQFDRGGVKVRGVSARLGEVARSELTARLAALNERDPRAPRVFRSIPNPGFEPVGGGALPGWRPLENSLGTAELDATNPRAGKTSLYLQSAAQPSAVESDPFPTPPTGQFAMTAFIRGRNMAAGTELKMVVLAEHEKRTYRWFQTVGGSKPEAHALSDQWGQYPILVNALPLQSGGQMKVRFELSGAGEVWIDELNAYDLLFPLPFYRDKDAEWWEFVKLIDATKEDFNNGRVTDCVRRLDGYWPRFYTAYTPLIQPRMASQPAPKSVPATSTEPLPESGPGLREKFFRNLFPSMR